MYMGICADISIDNCMDVCRAMRMDRSKNVWIGCECDVDGHVLLSCFLPEHMYSHSYTQMLLSRLVGNDLQLGSFSEWGGGVAC